jgi:fructuronate reductase
MRLSARNLPAPLAYDRAAVTPGIVHLGLGAFHRAHMAVYIDSLLAREPSWGIIGASLKKPDVRDALAPQDFLYTLAVASADGITTRVIGSIMTVLDASSQRAELIAAMADPRIRIVSLTVTEKGYCHDPATGELDPAHPDIVHDLAHPEAPVSAPGLIVRALELRRAAGTEPFTVLSCDNLPSNGKTVARIVTAFAALRSGELGDYIAKSVAFPGTMVDRIVPATTDADREAVASSTGIEDAWPIMTEPFTQWVVEDHFTAGRPDLASVGVQLVDHVEPFELMKLRMLNGSHSSLAYLGYLGGYQYVSEAIADPGLLRLVHGLMTEEVSPTLSIGREALLAYRDRLLERFANPRLKHRTWQIAMDGTQKLPQRLLGTIRDRLAAGQSFERLALGVAGWMRYVTGVDEKGQPIDIKDPMAERLVAIGRRVGANAEALASEYLAIKEVFGADLSGNAVFGAAVTAKLADIFERGALGAVTAIG